MPSRRNEQRLINGSQGSRSSTPRQQRLSEPNPAEDDTSTRSSRTHSAAPTRSSQSHRHHAQNQHSSRPGPREDIMRSFSTQGSASQPNPTPNFFSSTYGHRNGTPPSREHQGLSHLNDDTSSHLSWSSRGESHHDQDNNHDVSPMLGQQNSSGQRSYLPPGRSSLGGFQHNSGNPHAREPLPSRHQVSERQHRLLHETHHGSTVSHGSVPPLILSWHNRATPRRYSVIPVYLGEHQRGRRAAL
jgi:hypothetical protein